MENIISKTILVSVSVLIFTLSSLNLYGEEQRIPLNLGLTLNKSVYKVGESFVADLHIINNGDQTYYVAPNCTESKLILKDSQDVELETFTTGNPGLTRWYEVKTLKPIDPSAARSYQEEGQIFKKSIKNFLGEKYRGYFIDFGFLAFTFKGPGFYKIKAECTFGRKSVGYFENDKVSALEVLKHAWFGTLTSNEVEFSVVK